MSLNCSSETNAIDSNTVSIKYIVGGWLTLIFCLCGRNDGARDSVRSNALLFRYSEQHLHSHRALASTHAQQLDPCLSHGFVSL